MRVSYHFPHINRHQNIYSVPQWNIVGACVMAHVYDASARVLLTKKSGGQGHPAWVYKQRQETGTDDLSLVPSTYIRQLKTSCKSIFEGPNPPDLYSYLHKCGIIHAQTYTQNIFNVFNGWLTHTQFNGS